MMDNLARFGLKYIRVAKGTSCTKMIALFFKVRWDMLKYLRRPSKFTKMHKLFSPMVTHRHSTWGSADPDNEV